MLLSKEKRATKNQEIKKKIDFKTDMNINFKYQN